MTDKKNKKIGRPTEFSLELASEICLALATSTEGIGPLCKKNEDWPHSATVFKWRILHKEFGEMYARAKQQQVEALVDEIIEIADDTSQDTLITDEGKEVVNHEHINRSRLRIDTRKWLAAKLAPRVYGDKIQYDGNVSIKHEDALKDLM